jgi:hypothetical protein
MRQAGYGHFQEQTTGIFEVKFRSSSSVVAYESLSCVIVTVKRASLSFLYMWTHESSQKHSQTCTVPLKIALFVCLSIRTHETTREGMKQFLH